MIHLAMVFRRRSGSSIRPVHRIKHVIDKQGATAGGTVNTTNLIKSVDAPVIANTTDVETGSTVNGIYLKVEVVNTGVTGVLANAYLMVAKNPGGNLTLPQPNLVGADDNKKYVIHQEMLMLQMVDNSNPRTLFNGVIVIPRGYRRMAINDLIIVAIFSPGVELNFCIQCHYKEFR